MSLEEIIKLPYIEVKCPSCGRHLTKFKNTGAVVLASKCKSCKNNILTQVMDNRIIINQIDALENSRDIISPNRYSNPTKGNKYS